MDDTFIHANGLPVRFDSIIAGYKAPFFVDSHFTRLHKSVEDYSAHLAAWDDWSYFQYDNFERFKPVRSLDKHVVGDSPLIPLDDNDQNFKFYDIQGESIYTNPPDPNIPCIDHGLDEDYIWNFSSTLFNQRAVINNYTMNGHKFDIFKQNHVPSWGQKLATKPFFRKEKLVKWFRHWNHRIGLENIKMR